MRGSVNTIIFYNYELPLIKKAIRCQILRYNFLIGQSLLRCWYKPIGLLVGGLWTCRSDKTLEVEYTSRFAYRVSGTCKYHIARLASSGIDFFLKILLHPRFACKPIVNHSLVFSPSSVAHSSFTFTCIGTHLSWIMCTPRIHNETAIETSLWFLFVDGQRNRLGPQLTPFPTFISPFISPALW